LLFALASKTYLGESASVKKFVIAKPGFKKDRQNFGVSKLCLPFYQAPRIGR
jgi:hypothetical protein